jgi:hypothetical protein
MLPSAQHMAAWSHEEQLRFMDGCAALGVKVQPWTLKSL